MIDITYLLNEYRESARSLWNTRFLKQVSSIESWDIYDEFDDICTQLFSSLVLRPIGRLDYKKVPTYKRSSAPLLFLKVIPVVDTSIPINIARERTYTGYWDYPLECVKSDEVDMRLIDLFDFDLLGFRDFQYYRVQIVSSSLSQELIGRDALISCNHVKINFDDTA